MIQGTQHRAYTTKESVSNEITPQQPKLFLFFFFFCSRDKRRKNLGHNLHANNERVIGDFKLSCSRELDENKN